MLMPVLMFLKSAWFSGLEKGRFGGRVFFAVRLGRELAVSARCVRGHVSAAYGV
jgi:hypothetical protein